MIYALYLYGLAVLLGLIAAALSALPRPPAGRHHLSSTPERWAPSLGPGWVLHMDGTAEFRPRRGRLRWEEPW